ncbi:protein XRI1 [Cinnamomum micranthum f. kanehirae]|uniref:Protein XRI1 n=1 Tax=Cinnamomum micranthum f. kanehirae TaxID=337451 RepID=A0A3S4P8N5_9MAGN|nr:protein XRI1 [Cinnamomum micranthum f. kanehirae]
MDWQGDDYFMQGDSHLDTSSYLWDGVNHNEDDLLHMFEEMTPVKACADFNYDISDNDKWYSEGADKGSGECRESSQLKRRRMLQFGSGSGSDVPDPGICNEQAPYDYGKSKDIGNPMEGAIPENMQGVQSFSVTIKSLLEDDRCTLGYEGLDQSPERFFANCLNDNEMHFNCDELNASGTSYDQVEISEVSDIAPVMQTEMMQEPVSPAPRSIFKVISSKKSNMRTPTKLATSVAYPFAVIKPCGVQGDVTLKDINQRIRTPPLRSQHREEEEATPSYPTSAFSGKPVVVKTKIRTEGGKGSITIMRTKG